MTVTVNQQSARVKWISRIIIATFFALIILDMPIICTSHKHSELPSYEYFRKVHIYQHHKSQHHKYHDHDHVHERPIRSQTKNHRKNDTNLVLRGAIGSSFIIFVALLMITVIADIPYQHELKLLLSFASGNLLGVAFLYLIRYAFILYSHNSSSEGHLRSHSYFHRHDKDDESEYHKHNMSVGLCVILGLIVFLIVEKAVRIVKGDHSHSHVHSTSQKESEVKEDLSKRHRKENTNKVVSKAQETAGSDIKNVYLNLVTDFLDYITNGLAMGAGYMVGTGLGYFTTFTILYQMIPHEIRNFNILIQNGFSKRKAIILQLVTTMGVFFGNFLSTLTIGAGYLEVTPRWIFPFTAGGFIYIATVSIMPELLTGTKLWQSVKEILVLLLEVYIMVLIANYE